MGMYRYVTEEEVKRMKTVSGDIGIDTLLQEALQYNQDLLVEENFRYYNKKGYRGWLLGEREKKFYYQVYFESPAYDGSAYQAMYVTSVGSARESVVTYLFGIINGGLGVLKRQQEED